jgi:hypothetical protein
LAIIGLALVAHMGDELKQYYPKLTGTILKEYWQRGISPGHSAGIIRNASELLRRTEKYPIAAGLGSLWFKGSSDKPSKFANLVNGLASVSCNCQTS